ncbi:DUF6660 family protein [Neolewinella sp.]|uniref:DUF6660 family protein n=1 Tax=Neolewinella sp. TaxID=2993543 RepID=UPI003B52A95E
MRWQIILFAAYLFSLALVPCGDAEAVMANDSPALLHEDSPDHEHRDSDHRDHCTPFCICSCCSVVVGTPPAIAAFFPVPAPVPPIGKTVPSFSRNWTPLLSADASWQPPRA